VLRRTRTIAPHERSFAIAPHVEEGSVVHVIRDDEQSPGWFYGAAADGTEGYFPAAWFRRDSSGAQAIALRDYDAAELTIEANVAIDCIAEVAGWLLVQTDDGLQGWIPHECAE
jgi:hypothetical protein